jgi:predicted nucleic acid-binding protein
VIVVDTNVVSELMRPRPSHAVRQWVVDNSDRGLVTTAITVAEIAYGIERLPDGRRKSLLRDTADSIFTVFEDQVLPFGAEAAQHYATIVSARDRAGRPVDGFDAQIAAICRQHDSPLATRNGSDFEGLEIGLIDPWLAD